MKKSTTLAILLGLFVVSSGAALFSVVSAENEINRVSDIPNTQVKAQCYMPVYYLSLGSRDYDTDGEVSSLQIFLQQQGYFNATVTGYYGPITAMAVSRFQIDNGLSGVGIVGAKTRALIYKIRCGVSPVVAPVINSIYPLQGKVGDTINIYGSNFTSDSVVLFSSGQISPLSVSANGYIAFVVPEYLNPACYYSNPRCYLAATQVLPGNYTISVRNKNGTSNTINFVVTSTTIPNPSAPVISGIDSPTTLTVGQTGTWAIHASDPSNGSLSYEVLWGDETFYPSGRDAGAYNYVQPFVQTSTFTHSYSQVGTYTIKFTVRSSTGKTTQSSVTVQVR